MNCSLRDSLEWLYPDSTIVGAPITSLGCDVPAGGVADVNVLITDIVPDKPLRFSSDAPGGEFFRLKGLNHAKDGEAVMRTRAGKLLEDLKESYLDTEPRIPVAGRICLSPDRPLRLTVRTGENADADKAGTDPIQTGTRSAAADCLAGGQTVCAEAQGALVQRALKKPLDADTVERQIRKTGGTPYVFKKLDLEMPAGMRIPEQGRLRLPRSRLPRKGHSVRPGKRFQKRNSLRSAARCALMNSCLDAFHLSW